jgi:hypothetical protein
VVVGTPAAIIASVVAVALKTHRTVAILALVISLLEGAAIAALVVLMLAFGGWPF